MQMPSRNSLRDWVTTFSPFGNLQSRWNSSCESSREAARWLSETCNGRCRADIWNISRLTKFWMFISLTTVPPSTIMPCLRPDSTSTVNSTFISSGPSRTSPISMFGSSAVMARWRPCFSLSFLTSHLGKAIAMMPSWPSPKPRTSSTDAFLPSASWSAPCSVGSESRWLSGEITWSTASENRDRFRDRAWMKLSGSASCRTSASARARGSVNSTAMEPALCALVPARRSAFTSMCSGNAPTECSMSARKASVKALSLGPRTVAKDRSMKRQCRGFGSRTGTRSQPRPFAPSSSSARVWTRSSGSPRVRARPLAISSLASAKPRTRSEPDTTSSGMA
mmetsp:Transcript_87280/g.247447  ORF Transcript_87280/g.247447 Transcript_87280/m.247447 type:complete len:337 (-) Transcript_87280:155-1165(-)